MIKVGKGPGDLFGQVASIEAPDDHTVKFTLKAAFAPFLATLVDDGASIVNPKVMEHEANGDHGPGLSRRPHAWAAAPIR